MLGLELDAQIYRILIVEDEPAQLHLISGCLKADFAISVAKTQKAAMEILAGGNIDILLLDIALPDGNGLDICREVRSNKHQYGDISIIFMTGSDSMDDEVLGLRLGANDYIRKPFNYAVLRARVELQVQLIRKTQLLAKLANLDGLTEIPNRRAFNRQLEKEWNRAKRDDVELSLALIDVDYFKQFNDHYGHSKGDECLKKLSACMHQVIKRSTDFFARFGGEEFVVLLYAADVANAKRVIEKLSETFTNLKIPHEGSKVSDIVTFSCGICSAHPRRDNFGDILERADDFLYAAKANGRNRIVGGELGDET